jgi:2-polyprenyl-3-methyl-5-hydroxy-6-metoxy-1,4-benzoquinol methylase
MRSSIDPEGTETKVIHELVDFADADVLEVGCGDGRLTWRYADQAATVLAIDMNGEKIKRAAEAIPPSLRSKLNFVVADIADVELSPEAFDVAILAHSL